jgi:alcohol dehydrogenase class IV
LKLRDLGIPKLTPADLEELALAASTDPSIMFNPKEASLQDMIGIYKRAY